MFQTFISRHNSNFFSDKLVLTSVTPASSAPVLQTPKATSSTLYFDSLTVNAGNGGFLHCIQMDTSVNAANQVVSVGADIFFFQAEDGIRDLTVTGVQTCALTISPGGARAGAAARDLSGRAVALAAGGAGARSAAQVHVAERGEPGRGARRVRRIAAAGRRYAADRGDRW